MLVGESVNQLVDDHHASCYVDAAFANGHHQFLFLRVVVASCASAEHVGICLSDRDFWIQQTEQLVHSFFGIQVFKSFFHHSFGDLLRETFLAQQDDFGRAEKLQPPHPLGGCDQLVDLFLVASNEIVSGFAWRRSGRSGRGLGGSGLSVGGLCGGGIRRGGVGLLCGTWLRGCGGQRSRGGLRIGGV